MDNPPSLEACKKWGVMPFSVFIGMHLRQSSSISDLYVESEMHDVAILNNIFFPFNIQFPGLFAGLLRLIFEKIVVFDYLGTDEASFKVGVDNPGGLRGLSALPEGPGARFLGASSQVRLQTKGLVAGLGQLLQAGLLVAGVVQHLGGLVLFELRGLGLELGVEEDGGRRRH